MPPRPDKLVQTILFERKRWRIKEARMWLKAHGYKYNKKVDVTTNYYRFRQNPPNDEATYYTYALPTLGIDIVSMKF